MVTVDSDTDENDTTGTASNDTVTSIVLFYKYFLPNEYPLIHQHAKWYVPRLYDWQTSLCKRLGLQGRLLISSEGVNGTLSASTKELLQEYRTACEQFELVRDCGSVDFTTDTFNNNNNSKKHFLFSGIDWKESHVQSCQSPFPDLKIQIVKEIISSGSPDGNDDVNISVQDLVEYGGTHLDPNEFHQTLLEYPNAVIIDVRNTFEYDIGHFIHPTTHQAAVNPHTTTFSSFDSVFCAKHADQLRDCKVLMYCTGGIRCEKASAMLRKRGVRDVSQLRGGIHRYLETYGSNGYFKGLNFVFDQRVGVTPNEQYHNNNTKGRGEHQRRLNDSQVTTRDIVGRCVECSCPFDEISGSRICTVCRDLVLVCPSCQQSLREYHCQRHADWKLCYFTFLEVFEKDQLTAQKQQLEKLHNVAYNQPHHRRIRKTLRRQIDKVSKQIQSLEAGTAVVDVNAPKRCRSCAKPRSECDGLCWGFWKTSA